jgi:hypothetical protein
VPDHPLGVFRNAIQTVVETFVRTVAANEGIRGGGGTENVGVGVTIGQ